MSFAIKIVVCDYNVSFATIIITNDNFSCNQLVANDKIFTSDFIWNILQQMVNYRMYKMYIPCGNNETFIWLKIFYNKWWTAMCTNYIIPHGNNNNIILFIIFYNKWCIAMCKLMPHWQQLNTIFDNCIFQLNQCYVPMLT